MDFFCIQQVIDSCLNLCRFERVAQSGNEFSLCYAGSFVQFIKDSLLRTDFTSFGTSVKEKIKKKS